MHFDLCARSPSIMDCLTDEDRIERQSETSVHSCQHTLRDIPEEERPQLHRGIRLKSRMLPSSFREVKRPGREADHSSPSIVEVKREWIYVSIHLRALTTRTQTTLL